MEKTRTVQVFFPSKQRHGGRLHRQNWTEEKREGERVKECRERQNEREREITEGRDVEWKHDREYVENKSDLIPHWSQNYQPETESVWYLQLYTHTHTVYTSFQKLGVSKF